MIGTCSWEGDGGLAPGDATMLKWGKGKDMLVEWGRSWQCIF